MINFYDVILIGGVSTGFLSSIMLFSRSNYQYTNRMLGVIIFGWSWYVLLYLLTVTGWLVHVPGIYRLGSPVYYLIPALNYFYTRNVLLDETGFRKYDWLHFLPAFLHLIEMLPFYFADTETKMKVIHMITNDFSLSYQRGSGLIPAFWHFQLRWMLGIVYLVFQCKLMLKVLGKDNLKGFESVTRWLVVFTLFSVMGYTGMGTMSVFAWLNLGSGENPMDAGYTLPRILQVAGFMGMNIYLFFSPEVLYGIPRKNLVHAKAARLAKDESQEELVQEPVILSEEIKQLDGGKLQEREVPFNPELIEVYAEQVSAYIAEVEPFRKPGFAINELAQSLRIPIHHLSYVLNHYYKQRFTDFINSYRVNYLKRRLDNGDWRSFSLEGLAQEAGFSSRSTFFAAFKKMTGMTPSAYVQQNEMVDCGE